MGVKVTVVIKADGSDSTMPKAMTFVRGELTGVSGNPRYLGDEMQTAMILAATDVCRYLSGVVDLRDREVVFHAAENLLAVVEQPGNES